MPDALARQREQIISILRRHPRVDFQKLLASPELLDRLQFYGETTPLYEKYGVEQEVEKALRARVWLKSGGYIVINTMEAMTAIDVNTGKYTGRKDVEATILKTNLEAVQEITRQITGGERKDASWPACSWPCSRTISTAWLTRGRTRATGSCFRAPRPATRAWWRLSNI